MNQYIYCLEKSDIQKIKDALIRKGVTGDDLERALCSRLSDLDDIIDVTLFKTA
ncbi:hypothetical protein P8815_18025 [Bacillus altitudinis]|uniref:hypothetical protein n=1 Tax=Bacillus altitudinis TaxID=293387 RepID=UPI0020BD7E3B|nr:hypothetical protein [Bacillus altitudinis]MEC0473638.1 hypothetical protein [Bacillus altitudinis]